MRREPGAADHRGLQGARRTAAGRDPRSSARLADSRAASQAETRPAEALGEDTTKSIVRAVAVAVSTLVENGFPPVISRRQERGRFSKT